VLAGLTEGEPVVISGQFLLDSESNLKEAIRKMLDAKLLKKVKEKEDDFFKDMEEK
jgi:Cu(I)/Ag(I) efflux system membrane fusion protein/cobalt-zinc-cadmium efflux system membrane fusion protein